jgi:phosphoenolpyruvate carboxylase
MQQNLRDEISFLGEQLGDVIRQIEGEEAFQCIERIRLLARDFRRGDDRARAELADMISDLNRSRMRVVIRAFSIFLDLANLAEDRHRIRVLRHRHRTSESGMRGQSIHDAMTMLRDRNTDGSDVTEMIRGLDVELVFTAHPTEAKRRSVRAKLRHLRNQLQELDRELLPTERREIVDRIRCELIKLWQTDLVRPMRPTVMQEVERGLSIKRVLWDTAPKIIDDLRDAVRVEFPDVKTEVGPVLHFGSWIGGDRDGHPFVTTDVTSRAVRWLKNEALEFHRRACQRLQESLSFSSPYSVGADAMQIDVAKRLRQWPALLSLLDNIPPTEPYRRWLILIDWRLERTNLSIDEKVAEPGCYRSWQELAEDVRRIHDCLEGSTNELTIRYEIRPWLDRIAIFGFHLARLDIRQDAAAHRAAVDDLLQAAGIFDERSALDDRKRCNMLMDCFHQPIDVDEQMLRSETRETIKLFRWMAESVTKNGYESLGGYVVSMTRQPSDLLHVLWLWQFARQNDATCIPIIPLFETIDDLKRADQTLASIMDNDIYRKHVAHWDNRQTVMLGYSDGTKDGGYLAACWALFDAQVRLSKVAKDRELELIFFHGRGGSLGRGGGPAARSILALPQNSFDGKLRLTEQGEVLAERYDDPHIAYRHLEQILWAAILASMSDRPTAKPQWHEIMQRLAKDSRIAYRQLIDAPNFVEFFRKTTPLDAIEAFPIGSRPSRRTDTKGLDGLRAIPYVFSWTQCRWLVPAWYGIGASASALKRDNPQAYAELGKMYQDWPFFQAIIDNATLALAKADVSIGRLYAQLADDDPQMTRFCEQIHQEYIATRQAVLDITSTTELLQRIGWLRDSIHVRNYYTDPLNMIQVELLRRIQSGEETGDAEDIDSLTYLTRMTINGVASGMRTTG